MGSVEARACYSFCLSYKKNVTAEKVAAIIGRSRNSISRAYQEKSIVIKLAGVPSLSLMTKKG